VKGSDGSGDQTEHDEELSNIQRVKNLLINGPAFENFRVLLEFILAGKESPPVTDNPASTSAANSDQSQSAGDDANAAIKFGPKKLPYIQPLEAISHGTHQEGRNDPSCARPSVPENKMPGSFPDEPGNKASRDIILDSVTHYRLLACESHFST
jgi:hypothetical protein